MMDPFQALCELPRLIEDYKKVAAELAETKRELESLKDDKYVTWEWVCDYFGISKKTAFYMLSNEKIFVHNQKLKRIKKSMVIKFAEKNSIKVKDIPVIPHLNRKERHDYE